MTERELDLRRRAFSADPHADDALDELITEEAAARANVAPPLFSLGDTALNTLSGFLQLKVKAHIRSNFFPLALAHLLRDDENPLVSVEFRNQSESDVVCRTRVWIEGFSATSVKTISVPRPAGLVKVDLLPTLFPSAMNEVTEITAATVHVAVNELGGRELTQSTGRVWLLPKNAAILEYRDRKTGERKNYKKYLGAYVTPNAPQVLSFLAGARQQHPDKQFVGDRQANADGVLSQVKAIYDTLKDAGFGYVNSLTAFFPEFGLSGQRIRLPSEALGDKAGNCIDGVVLFASLLEAASLHPAIVSVPGHAFLAWERIRDSDQWQYLDTTLLGTGDFDAAVAEGARLARKFEAANTLDRYSLRKLRQQEIFPLV